MELPRICELCADIVPHRKWASSKWFYANPLWYYHRRGTDEQVVTNRKFYELVDPDLRQLCTLLNNAGLHTTPSCQGHFYERNRFERIWEELKRETDQIRNPGLRVKDCETDREFLFADADYILPWQSFDEFLAQTADHQGTGYLGIIVPSDRQHLVSRLAKGYETYASKLSHVPELSRLLGGKVFDITVKTYGPADRSEEWRKFTEWARGILANEK